MIWGWNSEVSIKDEDESEKYVESLIHFTEEVLAALANLINSARVTSISDNKWKKKLLKNYCFIGFDIKTSESKNIATLGKHC